MGNLLYIIAAILILFWAIGLFLYGVGALIHILIVVAGISILLAIIQGSKPIK